jgi:hypothetical protein
MPRLARALLFAALSLSAAPALANEFCDQELAPMIEQRKALTSKLQAISKRAKQEGSRDQFCGTLNAYIGNIRKFLSYLETNKEFCAVPDVAIDQAKKGLAENQTLRRKVCLASAKPSQQQSQAKPGIPQPPVELRLR